MSHEGDGMKLRDLARNSRTPTNFLAAVRILLSRLWNRGTARYSRRSYESVFKSSPVPHNLIFLQQTAMVLILGVVYHYRHSGSHVTLPVWAYNGDRNLCPRTCHKPIPSSGFPNIRIESTQGIPGSFDRWRLVPGGY